MVQVFITHDLYGRVKKVCSLFETVFGWSPHEVEGLRMPYLHREESSAALKTIVGDLSGGPRPFRTRGVTKSGAAVDMIVTGSRWNYCEGSTGEFVVSVRPIPAERDCRNARILSSIRKKLEMRNRELEASKSDLERADSKCRKLASAIGTILSRSQEASSNMEERLAQNYRSTVLPVIAKLQSMRLPEPERCLLDALEINLRSVVSGDRGSSGPMFSGLTPRQMQICQMIRTGHDSKEIGQALGLSYQTVIVHRKNIRKKLGLKSDNRSLCDFLRENL